MRECRECGRKFSEKEYLEEHYNVEHPGLEPEQEAQGFEIDPEELVPKKTFGTGILTGLLLAIAVFGGFQAYQEFNSDPVSIEVVTCDNCSYERFKVATDRLFNVRYKEVDYNSDRGQRLIRKYDMNHVPGFVFEKEISDRRNFSRVRNALVEFKDGYVMSDQRNRAAQRFSQGFSIS